MPALAPGNGQTKTARMRLYVCDDRRSRSKAAPAAWFAYTPNRQGIHPQTHLINFHGVLQADAYAGYNNVFAAGNVREAACMAHARRKIHDRHTSKPTATTTEALRRIGLLHTIEEQLRGQPPDRRREIRQEQARPLLDDFEAWLRTRLLTLSTQSDTTKAITYMLNQWQALIFPCEDGRTEIDSNIAENVIRPIAIGKKNWLFAGSERAGYRAVAIQSLFTTAKLNGLDSARWLADTLDKLLTCPNSQIDSLLPFANFTKS